MISGQKTQVLLQYVLLNIGAESCDFGRERPVKMEMKNMDEETWNSLVLEVREYLETDALPAGVKQIVELNLQIGTANTDEREPCEKALKAILKGRDGSPFGKRGSKSKVPATVRVSIDKICAIVTEAAKDYYNCHPIMKVITLKHTKSGGGQFEDAAEYANVVMKRERAKLQKMYSTGAWDGSLENLTSDEEE